MTLEDATVTLQVPDQLEPKLERQIAEYAQLLELGEQMGRAGMLDPSKFT